MKNTQPEAEKAAKVAYAAVERAWIAGRATDTQLWAARDRLAATRPQGRCDEVEINGKAGRRCTKIPNHGGSHVFGNWSLTLGPSK